MCGNIPKIPKKLYDYYYIWNLIEEKFNKETVIKINSELTSRFKQGMFYELERISTFGFPNTFDASGDIKSEFDKDLTSSFEFRIDFREIDMSGVNRPKSLFYLFNEIQP